MLRNLPFLLACIIIGILMLHSFIPLELKQILFAISLTIKSLIVLLLPFIIFSLLFKTIVGFARSATLFVALILICVCSSNLLSTFLSHFVGMWVYHLDLALSLPEASQSLAPAWSWQFPKLISNDKAMLLGLSLGLILGKIKAEAAQKIAAKLDWLSSGILKSIVYFIPFFVTGFVIKLQYEGVMQTIVTHYTLIFLLIALAQFTYILFTYAYLNSFKLKAFSRAIKNMLPAAIAGFSTMSSAAVMPMTITGAQANAKNRDLAGLVIPATVNIHLVGDCFAIPIFAYAVMKSYGMPEPALLSYLVFMLYFVLAKFSVAAIPGGGILVMLPILESCLGFNSEMLSLITALYILFDPVITCANVFGNGAFAKMIDKLASLASNKRKFSTAMETASST